MASIRVLFAIATLLPALAHAGTKQVKGYIKGDGTVVEPYIKTTPDSTKDNNYSTKGNVNPYTGKKGTK